MTVPAIGSLRWRAQLGGGLVAKNPVVSDVRQRRGRGRHSTALVMVNTVVYVRGVMNRGDSALGLALACYGMGSLLVAVATPRVVERIGVIRTMSAGIAVTVMSLAAAQFALSHACFLLTYPIAGQLGASSLTFAASALAAIAVLAAVAATVVARRGRPTIRPD